MQFLIYAMIIFGIALMITNIVRYISFLKSLKDVFADGENTKKDIFFERLALLLLIFFLCGYILTVILGNPSLLIAAILFGGSIFVSIVLTLLFNLVKSVKTTSLSMTQTLIEMVESRDPNLNGHSLYVRNLSKLFYKYLPPEMRREINPVSLEYAALMHDVGKLGIPERILNKPAGLDDEEWQLMKNHPKLGADFLRPLSSLQKIIPWILYHHERVDSKGYYGLKAEEIPLGAKIISVCDTYSAITMRRSYKEPLSHETAIKIINDVAGTQLDSELVEIFNTIPKAELLACIPDIKDVM